MDSNSYSVKIINGASKHNNSKQDRKNILPDTFNSSSAVSESFPLEEITHFTRNPSTSHKNTSQSNTNFFRASSEEYSSEHSEPLSVSPVNTNNNNNPGPSKKSTFVNSNSSDDDDDDKDSSCSDEYEDEITQYNRYDTIKNPGKSNTLTSSISDDNFPSILNSNATVTKSDVGFSIVTLILTIINFITDLVLVFWHYSDGHAWYSAGTAMIMTIGAVAMLHQFSITDMERLKRLFDHARRVRILINCFPTCSTIISSYYFTITGWKAKTNQMFALQYFSVEEFLQNLLRVQSFFQAAPQAVLQLLIFMETIHEASYKKEFFCLINITVSIIIMTLGNIPSRSEEFDSVISPGVYSPTTRLFIGLRMFSCFCSRTMGIVYVLIGINCLLGKFSTLSTLESFLISFTIILIPRFIFTFVDYLHRHFISHKSNSSNTSRHFNNNNLSCCKIFIGYLASIFFPLSDPLWIFWYIWFETITFLLFGNIIGWLNATECINNLVNTLYTGIFIIVFIIIPIFLPFMRASVKKRQLKKLENILESKSNKTQQSSSRTAAAGGMSTDDNNIYEVV